MMIRRVRWILPVLVLLFVWNPRVLLIPLIAPGLVALYLLEVLPGVGLAYGIDPEGGAASAIPLVVGVSLLFWPAAFLAGWIYRRRQRRGVGL